MPVVTLHLNRLQSLVSDRISKDDIISMLPSIGLDIEQQTKEYVRIEYSPNRPDYATEFGVAATLRGFFNIQNGIQNININKSNYVINIEQITENTRPHLKAIVAYGKKLDSDTIRQLTSLQEDLHNGIGKKRTKVSIGIHDLDKLTFPLKYTTIEKNHKFVPLGEAVDYSITDILKKFSVGKQYGHILQDSSVHVILDSNRNIISLPPIINSALTAIKNNTKNILVEITATDHISANDVLSIIAATLNSADYDLYDVNINGENISTILKHRKIILDTKLVKNILGICITSPQIVKSLKKNRLDAEIKKNKIICTIPRFRFDIFGEIDLVEEVLLGYGIENIKPKIPLSNNIGNKNIITKRTNYLTMIMIGLGYTEVLNSCLTNKQIQYFLTNHSNYKSIQVAESKTRSHYILRDMLLPSLLNNLSTNVHASYPQKLFEIGTVFSNDDVIDETINFVCVTAHKNSNYTEMKSVLQSIFKPFSITLNTKILSNTLFSKGRAASIFINKTHIGVIGEINNNIINNFKIRVPVTAFEVKLSGLFKQ